MIAAVYEVERVVGRMADASDGPAPRETARRFTAEGILAAIVRWTTQYGEPPTMSDWEPWRARRTDNSDRIRRWSEGDWPTSKMVCTWFGTFNAAISAAGFQPRRAPSRQRVRFSGPDAILEAIREWVRRYGDVPTYSDWDPARARRQGQEWRIVRYYEGGDWPSLRSVQNHFGTMSSAIRRAGLGPRPRDESVRKAEKRAHANLSTVAGEVIDGHGGLDELGAALRRLAAARREQDPEAMRTALLDCAAVSLAWAGAPLD